MKRLIYCAVFVLLSSRFAFAEVIELNDLYPDVDSTNSIPGEKEDYEEREFDGFKFYLHLDDIDQQEKVIEAVYEHYTQSLTYMKHRFPVKVMEKLKDEGVKIIIKNDCGTEEEKESAACKDRCPSVCYVGQSFWSGDDNAFEYKAIVIRDLEGSLIGAHSQPGILIHEMAHAFHDLIIGFDYTPIIEAYQTALNSGKYEQVNNIFTAFHTDREKVRAYAMKNHKEFFAEISEALWLRNNEEPFTFHDVFADEVLTSTREDGQRVNPVWSAWWSFSGPHGDDPWYFQTLEEETDEEDSNNVPTWDWRDLNHTLPSHQEH